VAAGGVPLILPRLSLAQSANGKLQHACIGVGGMGNSDLNSFLATGKVDIVAICDIDENNLNAAATLLPQARKYRDWREMLEKEETNIDSVNVTTPDHMHAPIAMSAIKKGKHVYCQKPLTHEIYEARMLQQAAREAGVVTQMGIQIHANIAYRMGARMLQDGAIGKIKEWHSWTSAPSWPQGMERPEGEDPVPPYVDWDLWLGTAPHRPYKADTYHPFKWRGWQDFGGGAVGDFACHIFDPVFMGIQPGRVLSIQAEVPAIGSESWPEWEIIHYEFGGSAMTADKTVMATWYDAGKQPPREIAPMPPEHNLPGSGSAIIGEEGVMVLPHWAGPMLYPLERFQGIDRPDLVPNIDHYGQWVDACLGVGEATANFDYAAPLAEAALLGNVANRFAGQKLEWDAQAMKVTNVPEANALLRREYRDGWAVEGLG